MGVASVVRVEMASVVNVVIVLSAATALSEAIVQSEASGQNAASALTETEAPPAEEDLVEDTEESVELLEEDAVETVEAAEVAAKSSASTKTLSPPWDKPHRRSKKADKARKIFSFRLERILHKQI